MICLTSKANLQINLHMIMSMLMHGIWRHNGDVVKRGDTHAFCHPCLRPANNTTGSLQPTLVLSSQPLMSSLLCAHLVRQGTSGNTTVRLDSSASCKRATGGVQRGK